MATSINYPKEVEPSTTPYKPKAQCRDTQTYENSVPECEKMWLALP